MADEQIIQMVKDSLHMSFTLDESSTRRLNNEIASGIAYIQKYGDPDASFDPGTISGQLLCEYVLRAESGATETFAVDFRSDLLAMRSESEAHQFAESQGYEDDA